MDLSKYAAGKASGDSKITRHGATTLLIQVPGGFDPETGEKLPPREIGMQKRDLEAFREAKNAEVIAAEEALERAMEGLNGAIELIDDAEAELQKKR